MVEPSITVRVPAIEKLLDYTASGVGAVAGPMLAPWRARRLTTAQLTQAEADAHVMRVTAEAQADSLRIITEAQASAREAYQITDAAVEGAVQIDRMINQSVEFRERKRVANIGSVVNATAEQLGDTDVPDEEPDHDWTARFFEYAQDVSSEDMQTLWAKVLAGEVGRPGSTSLRTLSVLRNLDRASAGHFATLCSLSLFYMINEHQIDDARAISLGGNAATNALSDYGLPYGVLTRLEEHGLITSDYHSWKAYGAFPFAVDQVRRLGGPTQNVSVLESAMALQYANDSWYLEHAQNDTSTKEIRIHGVAMSEAGKELSRVVTRTPNLQYSIALAAFLRRENLKLIRYSDGFDFSTPGQSRA